MNLKNILLGALTLLSFSAMPYGEDLSFDKLKDSCINYTKYGYQRPPSNIIVNCSNAEYNWEQTDDGEMNAETSRYLSAGLISDKNKVSTKEYEVANAPYTFACPNFKEILRTLKLELKSSCTELVNFEGDLKDFCLKAVNDTIGENPDLETVEDTGRVISSCSNRPSNRRSTTHQR